VTQRHFSVTNAGQLVCTVGNPLNPEAGGEKMEYAAAGYDDLDAHLKKLETRGLVYVIERAIDKDAEMHPLVRWQYRGGIAEEQRKAFVFTNITDALGRTFPGSRVTIGAFAANRQIYALGMNRPETMIGQAWLDAIAHPIAPHRVDTAPCQEVVYTDDALRTGQGLDALPIPVSTPGYDTISLLPCGSLATLRPGFRTSGSIGATSKPRTASPS
jgi:hypothetical protein